jgi:hypothetical protein
MSTQVRIYDSKALLETKAALVKFAEQVTGALASVDADISRLSQWLKQERPSYWKHEIRKREDKVLAAKTDIQRKIISQAPEVPSLILERRVLQRAQASTEEARKRLEKVKQWSPRWERDALLYKTTTSALSEALYRDIPLALSRLEQMMIALEAYVRMAPPTGGDGVSSDVAEGVRDQAQGDAPNISSLPPAQPMQDPGQSPAVT